MNVLITGAAGFLGSHLTDRYLHDGHMVVGIDNLLTGNLANLSEATETDAFRLVEADICEDWIGIDHTLRDFRPELILHFASPASPRDYARFPLETMSVNSRGTERCLDAALQFGSRFVFASTSEAYGDPMERPQRETYWGNVNPVGLRSCYDEAKRFGEALVSTYARVNDLDARIVRIFNTYGPRMRADDGRVIPNFVAQALAKQPLTVYGDGDQTRSFCYVDDLVEGVVRCAATDGVRGRVVNLGNPAECSIGALARLVCEVAGVPFAAKSLPIPPDDPRSRCPDVSLAHELFGWAPSIDLKEGLRRTIDYATRSAAMRSTAARADATT
ncbi:MAG TPA: NAD-dependent epimerase/dehydratase family protein [Candidatus Binatia bacterium]|nr:NAD-dependent epimerase/dehydratase family protein [Candidatus Binatia bacterium]